MRQLDAQAELRAAAEEEEDLVSDLDDPVILPGKILARLRVAKRVIAKRLLQRAH